MTKTPDIEKELAHSRKLAGQDTETAWGWGTPAGKLRARRRAELIIKGAGLTPGMNVLEIGCGTGNFTLRFAASGARITAVDLSPDMIAKAKKRGLPASRVRFEVARFEDMDAAGPFDAVIGSSILHHLDYETGLGKILDLLKHGGRISFAEPNMLNPQVFLERKLRFLPMFSYISPDETAFARFGLYKLLWRLGYRDIEITPFDWLHPKTPERLIGPVLGFSKLLESLPLVREFSGSLFITAQK